MAKKVNDPFKVVSEQLPFYPDLTAGETEQEPFIAVYISSTNLGDSPDPEKHIPVYIMADAVTGEKKYVVQSYAVKKAVDTAKNDLGSLVDVVFRLEFLGKKIVNGKPFNLFNCGYCSLKDWEAANKK